MAVQRKISLFQLLLGCVLLMLLVAKALPYVIPARLLPQQFYGAMIAQNRGQDPTQTPGQDTRNEAQNSVRIIPQLNPRATDPLQQNTTAVQNTCSPVAAAPPVTPPATGDTSKATPKCESTGTIDVAKYVVPECAGGSCGKVNGTSVTLTEAHQGTVDNRLVNLGGGFFNQYSNDIFFTYQRDDSTGYIRLMQDTIWGGGPVNGFFYCENSLQPAFYRPYDVDPSYPQPKWGAKSYPLQATCGQTTDSVAILKTYQKKLSDGRNISELGNEARTEGLSGLVSCNVAGQTNQPPTPNTSRLVFQGAAKCNGVSMNMLAFVVDSGAGKGEVSIYGENKGLVGWYQELDFSRTENQPETWSKNKNTDICALALSTGPKKNLPTYFEYNLQRQCGQTSEKVLGNLLDEYSVTCMPRSAYIVDVIAQDKCGLTGKGCANWNNTGELKLSANNSLFGLYRDEAAVTSRTGATDLRQKNRLESIEAFFTGKLDLNPLDPSDINQEADPRIVDTYQAPLYKNSTPEQQCSMVYNKLQAVKELCDPINRIEGDTEIECAINQYLPNSNRRYLDVLNTIGKPENCKTLINTPAGKEILSVDLSMEVAYRPAFIVMATVINDKEHANNPEVRAPGAAGDRFTQVDYFEIKVPSFGSDFLNKKTTTSISNPSRPGGTFVDPLRFTADTLMSVDAQEAYRKEEEDERNQIRAAAEAFTPVPSGAIPPGPLIGQTEEIGYAPIKCRAKDSANYSEGNCDNIARALVSFINASNSLQVKEDSIHRTFSGNTKYVPSVSKCEVDETDLYGNSALGQAIEQKYQVAEEAASLGSKLEAKNVGQYEKKTSAQADLDVYVPSLQSPPGRGTRIATTRIFFISPHNYTLMYARNAAMGLLTTDQQEAILKDENFTSVLKSSGVDEFKNDKTEDSFIEPADGNPYSVSIQVQREKANEEERKSSILWQSAASVANLFTRQFALITTTPESKTNRDTLKCTGPYATENWLKGNCNPEAAGDVPGTKEDIKTDTTASNRCFQVYVDDKAEARAQADVIRKNILTPKVKGYFERFMEPTPRMNIFYQSPECGNKYCFDYIMDRIIAETNISPGYVISLAFTESEGLKFNNPDDPNDPVGTHFGCGKAGKIFYPGVMINGKLVGKQEIGSQTIDEKLRCLINFFNTNKDLSPDELVRRHGSANGIRNKWHNQFIVLLSGGTSKNACEEETPDVL